MRFKRISYESSDSSSSLDDLSDRSICTDSMEMETRRRRIVKRNRVKSDNKQNNTFSTMEVKGNVLKKNGNMIKKERSEQDGCEEACGLKQMNVSLEDCFTQKDILNDSLLMHNIPLIYRIKHNKQIKKVKHEFDTNKSKNTFFNLRERRNNINYRISYSSSNETVYDSTMYTSLQNDSALTNNKENKYESRSLNTEEIYKKEINFGKENLNLANNYLVDKNDRIHSQQKINGLYSNNSTNNNLVPNVYNNYFCQARCISDVFSTENNNNIIASGPKIEPVKSPISLTEQVDTILNTREENLFHNINSLQRKRRISIDQIDERATKISKLNKCSLFPGSEKQSENMNSIGDNEATFIFSTSPQIQSESMTLTYSIDVHFEKKFIDSQLNNKEDISRQEDQENNNIDISKQEDQQNNNVDISRQEDQENNNKDYSRLGDQENNKHVMAQDNGSLQQSNQIIMEDKETENEADDCLSLDLDTEEYEFSMSETVLENYYKRNKIEFNKIYDNENITEAKNASTGRETSEVHTEIHCSPAQLCKKRDFYVPRIKFVDKFRGYCFSVIYYGKCNRCVCPFKHEFLSLFSNWYLKTEQHMYNVIDELQCYNQFLKNYFYYPLLNSYYIYNIMYILKVLKKLYEVNVINNFDASSSIKALQDKGWSLNTIVEKLTTIVDNDDYKFVNWIAKILATYTRNNDYWNTLRSLLLKVEILDTEVIEMILGECKIVQTNIDDVNKNVVQKLHNDIRSRINESLLSSFKNIMASNNNVQKTIRITRIDVIKSPNSSPTGDEFSTTLEEGDMCTAESVVYETVPQNYNVIENKNIPYKLHPIDDLPNPCSLWSRKRFWKLYVNLYCLQQGLEHDDYNYVVTILNSIPKDEQSLVARASYQILSKAIKTSPYKLTQIATSAVQTGATAVSYEILTGVTVLILGSLAKEKLWVLAYKLIKDLHIIIESEMQLYKLNAATVLLFAEICVENKKAVKAFTLVKRTNIIYTNRCRWKVQSVEEDSATRVKIIMLLLDIFCETFPEYGLALFDLIAEDQHKIFFPIDLSNLINKLVHSVISVKNHDMIIDVAKLSIYYGFTLNSSTLSTLLNSLFYADINLAKQMYKIAVNLGTYSTLQFHPVTFLMVNVNWSKEEMLLAIMDLLERLASNIGFAIHHVKAKNCSVDLIFEDIPTEKQLFQNKISNTQNDKKIKETKQLMSKLLQEEFHPPIFFRAKNIGKICRLNGKSVLAHITCNFS